MDFCAVGMSVSRTHRILVEPAGICEPGERRGQNLCSLQQIHEPESRRHPFGHAATQSALSPRSPLRMRMASAMSETKTLPSPILPERAAVDSALTTSSQRALDTTTSILTL